MSTTTPLSTELSHAVGPTEPALLIETIGANLEATVARFGDREAMVCLLYTSDAADE